MLFHIIRDVDNKFHFSPRMGRYFPRYQRFFKSCASAFEIKDLISLEICQLFPFYLPICTEHNFYFNICILDIPSQMAIPHHCLQPPICFDAFCHFVRCVYFRIFHLCLSDRNSHDYTGAQNFQPYLRVYSESDDDCSCLPDELFPLPDNRYSSIFPIPSCTQTNQLISSVSVSSDVVCGVVRDLVGE